MKIDYCITGISEEGDIIVELGLTPERAAQILLQEIEAGRAAIHFPLTVNSGNVAEIFNNIKEKVGDQPGHTLVIPVEKKGKKSPAGARSEKANATRESILKWHAKGWTSKDIVEKVGTVPSTVSKVIKDAGLTPNKKEKHERVAEAMGSTRTGRGVWHEKECCGSKGSRHMKTCKNHPDNRTGEGPLKNPNPDTALEYTAPKARALSIEEFNELKEAMKDKSNFMSGAYALSHKLSPREVNLAVMSATYDEYIEKGLA